MADASVAHDSIPLTVYGPVGIVDLFVPIGASADDVVREYSRVAQFPTTPVLYTRLGAPVDGSTALVDAGISSGDVVVALDAYAAPQAAAAPRRASATTSSAGWLERLNPGVASVLWVAISGIAAVLAAFLALSLPEDSTGRRATIVVLGAAAVLGALPGGSLAVHRVLAAPAFAGAAAFLVVWDPEPVRLPSLLGIAALVAALVAGVARALGWAGEQGLKVWIYAGVGVFAITGATALLGTPIEVTWSLLLCAATLAARFVPMLAVDVPDQYLLDLERLAVTAWSAREQPGGKRGRIVVPRDEIAHVAWAGTRVVTAASAAVMIVATVAGFLLLRDVPDGVQTVGARCQVGFGGTALLLAARDFRHALARALLRTGGLAALAVLLVPVLSAAGATFITVVCLICFALGALLAAVAVAVGRGWRSAWWSRRAEVAETMSGAFALAAVVPAIGLFQALWKLTS